MLEAVDQGYQIEFSLPKITVSLFCGVFPGAEVFFEVPSQGLDTQLFSKVWGGIDTVHGKRGSSQILKTFA
jgi:hypothetical protein